MKKCKKKKKKKMKLTNRMQLLLCEQRAKEADRKIDLTYDGFKQSIGL